MSALTSRKPEPMTPRAQRVSQQLYEDASLRGDLTDSEAAPLLKWGELEVARLDARNPDDAAFEEAIASLRRLLKAINRFVGQLAYSTPDDQAAAMDKISEHARTLGYNLPPNAPASLATAQTATDNLAVLSSLLAVIDSSVGSTAQASSVVEASSPPIPDMPGADNSFVPAPADTPAPLELLAQRLREQSASSSFTADASSETSSSSSSTPSNDSPSGDIQVDG